MQGKFLLHTIGLAGPFPIPLWTGQGRVSQNINRSFIRLHGWVSDSPGDFHYNNYINYSLVSEMISFIYLNFQSIYSVIANKILENYFAHWKMRSNIFFWLFFNWNYIWTKLYINDLAYADFVLTKWNLQYRQKTFNKYTFISKSGIWNHNNNIDLINGCPNKYFNANYGENRGHSFSTLTTFKLSTLSSFPCFYH